MMNASVLSQVQDIIKNNDQAEFVLSAIVRLIGESLQCDRCFLYLRHPVTQMGKVPFCWRRHDQIPLVFDADWKPEPPDLANDDPMFAAALRAEPSIFVEDVETAAPQVLNRTFEQKNFGHRALIHAHLCRNGQLWGVLQPCVFDRPRIWTDADRHLIATIEPEILPFAIAYVAP
ncbi:MAG: GAF domain-containing protein [Leptolyngbyaceae cyanobacterium bins.349]|nr:GAF domain-containing protein [Leptolyngbyaceae cyanobacterium bins.349]